MRTSKLRRLFKEQAKGTMPGADAKKRVKRELFPSESAAEPASKKGGKKYAWFGLAGTAAAVAVVVAALSLLPAADSGLSPGDEAQPPQTTVLTAGETLYAFTAATGGLILSANTGYADGSRNAPSAGTSEGEAPTAEQLDLINRYMSLVESLVAGDGARFYGLSSDRAEYAALMVAELRALDGSDKEIRIYCNETVTERGPEETESLLEGVMIADGTEFSVRGERSVEADEEEFELTAVAPDGRRVVIEQELEEDEREFFYAVYDADGVAVDTFELETSDEETELKLRADGAGGRLSVAFKSETENGVSVLRAVCEENGVVTRFTVRVDKDPATGRESYVYTYSGGEEIFDREDPFDDDDDDDDEEDDDDEDDD